MEVNNNLTLLGYENHLHKVNKTLEEVNISRPTFNRCLHECTYREYTASKTLATLENKKARLNFATKHLNESAQF